MYAKKTQIFHCVERTTSPAGITWISYPFKEGPPSVSSHVLSCLGVDDFVLWIADFFSLDFECFPHSSSIEEWLGWAGCLQSTLQILWKVYTGHTGKQINTRDKQHQKSVFNGNYEKSALAEHTKTCQWGIDWENVCTLSAQPFLYRRAVREALEIQREEVCNP